MIILPAGKMAHYTNSKLQTVIQEKILPTPTQILSLQSTTVTSFLGIFPG